MGLSISLCVWIVSMSAGSLGRPRKPDGGIETEGRKQDLEGFLLSDGRATEWASLAEGWSPLLRPQVEEQGCRFGHAEFGCLWDSMG